MIRIRCHAYIQDHVYILQTSERRMFLYQDLSEFWSLLERQVLVSSRKLKKMGILENLMLHTYYKPFIYLLHTRNRSTTHLLHTHCFPATHLLQFLYTTATHQLPPPLHLQCHGKCSAASFDIIIIIRFHFVKYFQFWYNASYFRFPFSSQNSRWTHSPTNDQ